MDGLAAGTNGGFASPPSTDHAAHPGPQRGFRAGARQPHQQRAPRLVLIELPAQPRVHGLQQPRLAA